jgi:hypothetical protein
MSDKNTQPRVTEQADEETNFEAWAVSKFSLAMQNHSLGGYARSLKKTARDGWMARAELTRQAAPVAPTQQAEAHDYSDPTLACSSCGLTMGESRTLGHIQMGVLAVSPTATTASASDGSIYEAVSRRADPEGHAEAMAQMDEVLGWQAAPEAPTRDTLTPQSLVLLRKGLRDWETPENRYAAQRVLDAIEAAIATSEQKGPQA